MIFTGLELYAVIKQLNKESKNTRTSLASHSLALPGRPQGAEARQIEEWRVYFGAQSLLHQQPLILLLAMGSALGWLQAGISGCHGNLVEPGQVRCVSGWRPASLRHPLGMDEAPQAGCTLWTVPGSRDAAAPKAVPVPVVMGRLVWGPPCLSTLWCLHALEMNALMTVCGNRGEKWRELALKDMNWCYPGQGISCVSSRWSSFKWALSEFIFLSSLICFFTERRTFESCS